MIINQPKLDDLDTITEIYASARKFMAESGNPNQWTDGYPDYQDVANDMLDYNLYVIRDDDKIVGVFAFILGEEPTYNVIENGSWHYDLPYGTIHRIASTGKVKNISEIAFNYCLEKVNYLRIDTHQDNIPMQNAVKRFGFKECGTIHVRNGARIAFDYKR